MKCLTLCLSRIKSAEALLIVLVLDELNLVLEPMTDVHMTDVLIYLRTLLQKKHENRSYWFISLLKLYGSTHKLSFLFVLLFLPAQCWAECSTSSYLGGAADKGTVDSAPCINSFLYSVSLPPLLPLFICLSASCSITTRTKRSSTCEIQACTGSSSS